MDIYKFPECKIPFLSSAGNEQEKALALLWRKQGRSKMLSMKE